MKQQFKVLVFSHTHWDREWYRTFQQFRFGLVEVIDQILNLLQANEYDYFILDGQTVVLEDYLEIRPELKSRLAKWISSGHLVIGPWYILPDEFLVSGEALVRNLLLGKSISKSFGKFQTIGYLPDMFGHIAQIPQILKGFNIHNAVVWRGVNPKNSLFIWEGLDESKVLTTHLSEGYYNTFLINYENQKKDLENHLEKLKTHAFGDLILFPNGGDHLAATQNIRETIEDVNKSFPNYKFIQSTIEEYFKQLEPLRHNKELEVISGELRDPARAYILPGVFSARMYLKQKNFKLQNLLTDLVEPLSSLSWILGNEYNQGFIDIAWKELLKNQPHDSICGCSIDQVHKEMMQRFDSSEELCEKIINNALKAISKSFNLQKDETYLISYNASNWKFTEIQELTLDFLKAENVESFKLEDLTGKEVSYELLEKKDMKKFVSEIDVLPDWIEIRRFKIVVELKGVTPLGFSILKVIKNSDKTINFNSDLIVKANKAIANNFIEVFVENNLIKVKSLLTNESYKINAFETSGDAGDEYNYSPPQEDTLKNAIIKNHTIYNSSDYSITLKVDYELEYSAYLNEDRKTQSSEKVLNTITSYITLKANDPMLYFKTTINNLSQDHRLRVNFSASNNSKLTCIYDTQFGLLEQPVKVNSEPYDMEKYKERKEETFAIQNFADLSNNNAGITVITKGLPEVEIIEREDLKNLSLTLLRSVGWLSRDDLRTRGGGAGPAFPTPEAQCLGLSTFEYSVYLHKKGFLDSDALQKGLQANKEMRTIQYIYKDETQISFNEPIIQLKPNNLIVSTIKRSEAKDGLIIRFYNPMPYEQEYELKTAPDFAYFDIEKTRLDETSIEIIEKDEVYYGMIKPSEIITIKFKTVHLS